MSGWAVKMLLVLFLLGAAMVLFQPTSGAATPEYAFGSTVGVFSAGLLAGLIIKTGVGK